MTTELHSLKSEMLHVIVLILWLHKVSIGTCHQKKFGHAEVYKNMIKRNFTDIEGL